MPFVQSVATARASHVGPRGLSDAAFEHHLALAGPALDRVRARARDASLPLLGYPGRRDDLAAIEATAHWLREADTVVVFGTGGSSLGGQALAQAMGYGVPGLPPARPRLVFLDNLDPDSFAGFLSGADGAATRALCVSKSGGTGETLMQTIAWLEALRARGLPAAAHTRGLTEPARAGQRNGLRDLLTEHGIPCLDHDPGVGGRYAALTAVGLVPAAVAGLDPAAVRAGAAEVLGPVLAGAEARDVPAAIGAAVAVGLAREAGLTNAVLMAYADRFERLTAWYVQLWAESLGKGGQGTTPVRALGPVDQHSQLQLFLDGPRDKFVTVLTLDVKGRGPALPADLCALAGEPAFAGRTLGDLVAAQGRATAETFAKNGIPVRTLAVSGLDAATMGGLMMHFMLETILAADLLGVDAFDQPAVEEGKRLAKAYLQAG